MKNRFFQVKNLLEKINFSIEKIKNFRFFLKIEIFKIIFLHDEKIFFDGIFLIHLLIQENRLEAVLDIAAAPKES